MATKPVLVLGSKNYSSWSLRPWLHLRKVGFDFDECIIHFDAADYKAQIAQASNSRRVPVLQLGSSSIWDSLAICEFASDATHRGLPEEPVTRGLARSVASEMHAGFQSLRECCPMNVRAKNRRVVQTSALVSDIRRIDQLWCECRSRCAHSGPWLFGEFSIADAMFAPVVYRFHSYETELSTSAQAYCEWVLADPVIGEWTLAAQTEGHPLPLVDDIGL